MQADVCHAYQILKRGGLNDENIVVFMYDDIAKSELNPRPGVIINHPNGSDVYAGVPKVITKFYILLLFPFVHCVHTLNFNQTPECSLTAFKCKIFCHVVAYVVSHNISFLHLKMVCL